RSAFIKPQQSPSSATPSGGNQPRPHILGPAGPDRLPLLVPGDVSGVNCNRSPPFARTAFFFYACFCTKSHRKLCPRRIFAVSIEQAQKAKENEGSKTTGAVVARDAAGGARGGARRAARASARAGRPDQVVRLTRPAATECATKRSGAGGIPYPAR